VATVALLQSRARLSAVVLAVICLVVDCSSGHVRVAVRAPGAVSGWRTVSYALAEVDVPSSWPVYDLAADPSRCVRFDEHAVYLGQQGPSPSCPARVLGRAEAVQLQPFRQEQAAQLGTATTEVINGTLAWLEPDSDVSHMIVASFPGLDVTVSVSYLADRALAEQIVRSIRKG
jgi:hypothetical protein